MSVRWSVFSLSKNRANRSNWWFTEISKRFLMSVQWFVFSLNENRANRSNWWFAEILKRSLNGFQSVFSLGMNKTSFIFDFHSLKMKIYFMFFDLFNLLKRVWKWWFKNNVFFKNFWFIKFFKTRFKKW